MPSPFPGFDPYIEQPAFWRGFHNNYIAFLTAALNEILPPGFAASTEERVYLLRPEQDWVPDVVLTTTPGQYPETLPARGGAATLEATTPFTVSLLTEEMIEPYIEVWALGEREEVVAVLEVISPANKSSAGGGRDLYLRKQAQLLQSNTHLLEVDLLRAGQHTVAVPKEAIQTPGIAWDYLVCLHRGGTGYRFQYWPFSLRTPLPRVYVPLTEGVADVVLDLQACFERAYDAGPYSRRVDYHASPTPPLSSEDAEWLETLLRDQGYR
ncbi:MAG: DUF4058 family protein [Armatimonadaceae bacterium]